MSSLDNLFSPIRIGDVQLKNRIVMLAMTLGYGENHRATERLKNFYAEIARGGTGFITVGMFSPSNLGEDAIYKAHSLDLGIYSDDFIPELRELTQVIHDHGAKAAAQLSLSYEWRKSKELPLEPVAPSPVVPPPGFPPPRELKREEIHQIVAEFGEGARRARESGFDAVEFHAGIGYLINRFLSPRSNKRTDEYGGSLKNRMRFLLEIIESARKKAGDDYTYICRISADEFIEDGNKLEDTKQIASILEKVGIAALSVQAGWHESRVPLIQSCVPSGAYVYLAEEIKKVVNLPIIAAYRINDPFLAEDIIAKGRADLVGMGRALIADPELPNKAKEGRFAEIRTCIACCRCLDQILVGNPVVCTVNPAARKTEESAVRPARQPKKVLVVGGGPGGMEAAIIAAQRGHEVTLIEKEPRLGGQLNTACLPPFKEEIAGLRDCLIHQVEKNKVGVRLNQEATIDYIKKENPDAVILAAGANPVIPEMRGVNGDNVITAVDLLKERKAAGERVAVIGGGMVGCEIAELLADDGKKVTIFEMLDRIGADIGRTTRWIAVRRLREKGVKIETKAQVEEITGKGLKVNKDGSTEFFEADTIVLAVGMMADKELCENIKKEKYLIYTVGDCAEPGKILEAIETGFQIGKKL